MTLILSEEDVRGLIDMKEVVSEVEEAFRRQGTGEAVNSPRTRTRSGGSVLNVMHSSLPYLGRGGLKAYMSSKSGTRFAVVLFDLASSQPLAVMGADLLGRYRTGAASGVATKHLYRGRSGALALFGSGRQAFTQVLAVGAVVSLEEVRVWSPDRSHREAFARRLQGEGFRAKALASPSEALDGSQLASAITSSKEAFLTEKMLGGVDHANLCGGNQQGRSEATPDAIGSFDTVVVDDARQARVEYGDLIMAAEAGTFRWESASELGAFVAGKAKPSGKTLFKSGGVALEDVAVASAIYDKAAKSGKTFTDVTLA